MTKIVRVVKQRHKRPYLITNRKCQVKSYSSHFTQPEKIPTAKNGTLTAKRYALGFLVGRLNQARKYPKRKWKKHSGEIRLLISKTYRRKGLGMLLARELYLLAISEKVEDIIVKMMKIQEDAINIFKRMGFKQIIEKPD